MSKRVLFLTFLYVMIFVGIKTSNAQTNFSELTKFDSWNITILGIQTDNYALFPEEQKQLSLSIIPIISAVIKEVDTRYLSSQEQFSAREMKRQDALLSINSQIESALLSLDTESLSNESRDIKLKRFENQKQVKELRKRYEQLTKLKNKEIPLNSELPIKLIEQTRYINISYVNDLQAIAGELQAHSLIYFRIYPLEQYKIVEVYEYNIVQRQAKQLMRTVVDPKNISQLYSSLQYSLHSIILSSPKARLRIEVNTSNNIRLYDAQILIDGDLVGFGETSFTAITAGTHAISIIYKNKLRNEVIVIQQNDSVFRDYLFDISTEDTVTIQSNPSNVKVYINSEWVGNTPTVISRPQLVAQLELIEPGYETYRESITPITDSIYSATLTPTNPIPLADRLKDDRKQFYTAFSIFASSLALPIIFNGLYINELNAIKTGGTYLNSEGLQASRVNQNAYLYTYIGTSVLSAGLAVYAYIKLRKYLNTASEYHER